MFSECGNHDKFDTTDRGDERTKYIQMQPRLLITIG